MKFLHLARCCAPCCTSIARRKFIKGVGAAGLLATAPSAAGVLNLTAGGERRHVSAREFFPGSHVPEAVRERLANRLLGPLRVRDPGLDDYFRTISIELAPDDEFLIVTAASDDINAFAHFGGVIVMMRGMWDFSRNEDEFLGIVAHEMGHVILNHFESKRKLDETISAISVPLLIAGLLAGSPEVRETIIVGGSGIITGQIYGHSRELEHEADVVGLDLLTGAGRDGRQVAALLGRLGGSSDEYISTHPAPLRRAAYIKDRLLGNQNAYQGDSLNFLLLREKLHAGEASPSLIESKQRDMSESFGNRKTAAQFALLLAAGTTGDKVLGEEMDAALANEDDPLVSAARGSYAGRNGEHGRAMEILAEARELHPESAAVALEYAFALRRAGEHGQLLAERRDMPDFLSKRPDILREAAQSASALQMVAESNLLLAQAHIREGEFELAGRQLEIAQQHKMTTPMLVRANNMKNTISHEMNSIKPDRV